MKTVGFTIRRRTPLSALEVLGLVNGNHFKVMRRNWTVDELDRDLKNHGYGHARVRQRTIVAHLRLVGRLVIDDAVRPTPFAPVWVGLGGRIAFEVHEPGSRSYQLVAVGGKVLIEARNLASFVAKITDAGWLR